MHFQLLHVWHLFPECQSSFQNLSQSHETTGHLVYYTLKELKGTWAPLCVLRFPASSSCVWDQFCYCCSTNHKSHKGEMYFQWRIPHWRGEHSFSKNRIWPQLFFKELRKNFQETILEMFKDKSKPSNECMVAGGRGMGEIVGEFGIYKHIHIHNIYTLLCLKGITNKDLLFSTWSSAQCCVVAWMEGEFGGEWIHVYKWLCPFTVHLKLS